MGQAGCRTGGVRQYLTQGGLTNCLDRRSEAFHAIVPTSRFPRALKSTSLFVDGSPPFCDIRSSQMLEARKSAKANGQDISLVRSHRLHIAAAAVLFVCAFVAFFLVFRQSRAPGGVSLANPYAGIDIREPFPGPLAPLTVYDPALPLVRVGRDADGGYAVASLGRHAYDLYLAGGVERDTSFDRSFFSLHYVPEGFAYDGTIDAAPEMPDRLTWVRQNIGFGDGLADLTDRIQSARNVFLKLDIEGAEWDWLNRLDESLFPRFRQVVLEIHHPGTGLYGLTEDEKLGVLAKLARHMVLVHVHGNNFGGVELIRGVPVPVALELTYVRSGEGTAVLGQVPRRTAVLPDPHVDRRNHSGAAEMLLSYPPFIAVPGESSLHALMAAT